MGFPPPGRSKKLWQQRADAGEDAMKNLREYLRLARIQIHRSQRFVKDPDDVTLVRDSSATSMVVELSSHPFCTNIDLIKCLHKLGLQPGTSDRNNCSYNGSRL